MTDKEILTRPCPECYLCGSHGSPLYQGLKDRLFDTPGEWGFKRCLNPDCRLVWLDPIPREEEMGKAYQIYYTHHTDESEGQDKGISRFLRWNLQWMYNWIKIATLIRYQRKRHNLMYLDKIKPANLLEIGCGDGRRLARLRLRGWKVEGQEVDPKAADCARSRYGLTVHLGALKDQCLPDNTYDAIILNHVIEHLYNPISLLTECRRILKHDGVLVAITPNIESLGFKLFGSCWRGLEPPRHLHLFSQSTLRHTAAKSGFDRIETWTSAVKGEVLAMGSLDIKYTGHHRMDIPPRLYIYVMGIAFQLWAMAAHLLQPDSGEECVLRAVK